MLSALYNLLHNECITNKSIKYNIFNLFEKKIYLKYVSIKKMYFKLLLYQFDRLQNVNKLNLFYRVTIILVRLTINYSGLLTINIQLCFLCLVRRILAREYSFI